jgi:predicted nucleotidyltransferase
MSISESFIKLLSRIQPSDAEIEKATTHASTMKSRLEKYFTLSKFELIGSHSRGSAIKRYSDVDYFALFSREDVRWGEKYIDSRTLLNRVARVLKGRYTETAIRRDGQAIIVNFGDGNYAVDIVPAFFEEFDSELKSPMYSIPDGVGGWTITSPKCHNRFILDANVKSNSNLIDTVQLIKYWQNCRISRISLKTFHLEMILASSGIFNEAASYAELILETFDLLYKRQCRPLRDPLKISGYINATNTELQRDNLFNAVSISRDRAIRALELESKGKIVSAHKIWSIIFNDRFPSFTK